MPTSHEIILQARHLAAIGSNGFESDEDFDAWQAQVDALGHTVADKVLARKHAEVGLRDFAVSIRESAERMLGAAKRIEAEADRVDAGTLGLLRENVAAGGAARVNTADGGWAKLAVRKSESVEVDDPEALPPAFVRTKTEPDKAAIKAALKAGDKVPGARLVENEKEGVAWSR